MKKILYLVLIVLTLLGSLMPTGKVEASAPTYVASPDPRGFWAHNYCGPHRIGWATIESVLKSVDEGGSAVKYFAQGLRVKYAGQYFLLPYNDLGTIFTVAASKNLGGALSGKALAAKQELMQDLAKKWTNAKPASTSDWEKAVKAERDEYSNNHCGHPSTIPVPSWIPVRVPAPAPGEMSPIVMSDGMTYWGHTVEKSMVVYYPGRSMSLQDLEIILKSVTIVATGLVIIFSGGTIYQVPAW